MKINHSYLNALGEHIREMRKARGYSQMGFAMISKINRNYYSAVERGQKNVTVFMLLHIASTLNCRVADLFAFETEENTPPRSQHPSAPQ